MHQVSMQQVSSQELEWIEGGFGLPKWVSKVARFGGKVAMRGGLGANLVRILVWPEPAY